MSLALNTKPTSQWEFVLSNHRWFQQPVISALEKNVFHSPFLLNLYMCAQRIESVYVCPLYLLSIQYQYSTRVLKLWRWIQISCLSFSLLSFPYHPFAFIYNLSFCCYTFFWIAWGISTKAAFPFWASLDTYFVSVMLSWLSLALLVPLILHSCLTLCGQVPPRGSSHSVTALSHSVPHQTCLDILRALHHKRFSTSGNSVLVERNLCILSESHQEDNVLSLGIQTTLYT